jgi:hypothetical protein
VSAASKLLKPKRNRDIMTKGQKNKLHFASKAIANGYEKGTVKLGASEFSAPSSFRVADRHGRPFASVYLARRAGYAPTSQYNAQSIIESAYGLSATQAAKVDRVAASTHNVKQRGERVGRFLARVAHDPSYVGMDRSATTGAVAASL